MSYNTYHTDLKIAVSFDLASAEILESIPKSTLYRFRNNNFASIIGLDSKTRLEEKIRIAKEFLKNTKAVKLFKAALFLRDTKIKLLKFPKKMFGKSRELIINSIIKVKESLNLSRAARFFSISVKTFHNWKNSIRHKCTDSAFSKCVRVWPNQLTKNEVHKMKYMLSDKKYTGWSIRSLASYALKHNILSACVSTWYRYVKLLDIKRIKAKSRRKNRKTGIRAKKAHQIWHMAVFVNLTPYIFIWFINNIC